jgi:hypothetical protein
MPDEESETSGALSRRERALSRWENEGGSGPDGHVSASSVRRGQVAMPQMGSAEMGAVHIRVIALENLVVALLANAPEKQLKLARDMAGLVAPRAGSTQHPLTSRAATHMTDLIARSTRFRNGQRPGCDEIE